MRGSEANDAEDDADDDHGGGLRDKASTGCAFHRHRCPCPRRWAAGAEVQSWTPAPPSRSWPDQGWKGSNSWRMLAGSPSNSAEGMTPKSPSPALKTVMQTMRVVARFHARA